MTVGYMGVERSRSTGLPATQMEQQEFLDEGTYQKRKLSMGGEATISLTEKSLGINELSPKNIALNIEKLTEKNDRIAIIHADGNGLGEVIFEFLFRDFDYSLADGDARSFLHDRLWKLQDGFLAFYRIVIDTFDVTGGAYDLGGSLEIPGRE